MDVDDVSKDSIHSPPLSPRGICSEDEEYETPNDILIYDKNLVSQEKNIVCYEVTKPIGYAVLVGSDRSRHHDTYSKAIRGDLKLMSTVMKGLDWTVFSPCHNESSEDITFTRSQWEKVLKNLESKSSDFKQYSCFLFYYSGHGISRSVILSDGERLPYKEIICKISKIPSLQYKPKIFIFDCCREDVDFEKYEDSKIRDKSSNKDGNFENDIREVYEEGDHSDGYPPADTMICFSASEGSKSWMEQESGSIFTLQFAHALLQFSYRLSLCELLTQVIGGTVQIAQRALNRLQRPVFITTMTRMLILNAEGRSSGYKDVVYRGSAHTEQLEPCNMGQPQHKGPFISSKGNQDSDVCKDTVTVGGQKVARKSFKTRQDVESHLSQLGEGVSVFIVYAPDPESPYFDPREREAQISQNERLVFRLAYDLECHGFHVVTDLHLGDKQPHSWLRWYTSRISLCDFVILVCSPAFNKLFSHAQCPDYQIIDRRAKLLLSYRNAVDSEIMSEVQSKQNGGKFVPIMLHPYWSVEECVPALFRAGAIYDVFEEQQPRRFTYDNQIRGFERLVCRMAGINRMELDKPPVVGVHQLGPHIREGGEFDQRRLLEAAKKPRKGYKIVKPGQLPPSGSAFRGTSAAAPHPGFSSHLGYMQQPPPAHVYSQQMPFSVSHTQHLTMPPFPSATQPTTSVADPTFTSPHPSTAPPTAATMNPSVLPDKEPSPSVILWLSDKIVRWKFIGRFLGLENHVLDRIEVENQGDVTEQCYLMLDTWRVQRSSPYSYRMLGEQLLKSEGNRALYPEFVKMVTETDK